MEHSVSVPVYLAGEIEVPGSDAIEVVAMQGEQVTDVAHLGNPNGGRANRTTWLLLGSGAAAALAALLTFFLTVAKEAAAKGAFDEFVRRGGAADKFVWPHVSRALDLFAFAFLAYAIVAIIRGLRRLAEERAPSDFTIGTAPGVSCTVAAGVVPNGKMPLVRAQGGGWDVVTCAGMTGEIEQGLHRQPLVGGAVVPLPHGTRVIIDAGSHRFFVHATTRAKSHVRSLLGGVRWDEQTYLAGSAVAHVLVLIGLLSVPRDARALNQDDLPQILAQGHYVSMPKEEKDDLLKKLANVAGDSQRAGLPGRRSAGPEGEAGSSKIKNKNGALRVKGPANNPDPAMAKALARQMALSSEPLRRLGNLSAATTGSIWGREGALGRDAEDTLGNLTALEPGDSSGHDGLGLRGTGTGGGGNRDAFGTIGLAKIGTIGRYGNGSDYGMGRVGGLPTRHAGGPDATALPPKVNGRIDKEIIRRIVRRHLNEVKYCYEQEVMKRPSIGGRLVVQFTIAGNGVVTHSAVATSMGDATVDHCVTEAVRRWEFPQPENAGIVIVSYPFVLALTGS